MDSKVRDPEVAKPSLGAAEEDFGQLLGGDHELDLPGLGPLKCRAPFKGLL